MLLQLRYNASVIASCRVVTDNGSGSGRQDGRRLSIHVQVRLKEVISSVCYDMKSSFYIDLMRI
jgi:hypothetical protein